MAIDYIKKLQNDLSETQDKLKIAESKLEQQGNEKPESSNGAEV
jgi:hypothetical protein